MQFTFSLSCLIAIDYNYLPKGEKFLQNSWKMLYIKIQSKDDIHEI